MFIGLSLVTLAAVTLTLFDSPEFTTDSNWGIGQAEAQVSQYLETCVLLAAENGLDLIGQGAGFMFDSAGLPEGFSDVGLLADPSVTLPVYVESGVAFPVMLERPANVKSPPDYPCYSSGPYACDEDTFNQMRLFPFGLGSMGSYPGPKPSLYKSSQENPAYLPHCTGCRYSVQQQLEAYLNESTAECLRQADDAFSEMSIGFEYLSESACNVSINEDDVVFSCIPNVAISLGSERSELGPVVYASARQLKKLFVLVHGGSLAEVLDVSGILDSESRDPYYIIETGAANLLQNILRLSPDEFAVSQQDIGDMSLVVVTDLSSEYNWRFVVRNRNPFIRWAGIKRISLADTSFSEVLAGTGGSASVRLSYEIYIDARDPDDSPGDPAGDFQGQNDGTAIASMQWLDTGSVSATAPVYSDHLISFSVTATGSTGRATELRYSDGTYTASPGKEYIYIDSFDYNLPLEIIVEDSHGNSDSIILAVTGSYRYGSGVPQSATIKEGIYQDVFGIPFLYKTSDSPHTEEAPCEAGKPCYIYFYGGECPTNFSDIQAFQVSALGSMQIAFLPTGGYIDPGLAPTAEGNAIALAEQEIAQQAFGYNNCCPHYRVVESMRRTPCDYFQDGPCYSCSPGACCVQFETPPAPDSGPVPYSYGGGVS